MIGPATELAANFSYFAQRLDRNGVPPLWKRDPGFASLVHIILEQQVSLASAQAAFSRLVNNLGVVTPDRFAGLDAATARIIGFSHQKFGYCLGIARLLVENPDLLVVDDLDDAAAFSKLCGLRGVGPWTAAVYLMFADLRCDLWPRGDRALVVSMESVMGLSSVPTYDDADAIAEAWAPHRATAARILWHDYLGGLDYSDRQGIAVLRR